MAHLAISTVKHVKLQEMYGNVPTLKTHHPKLQQP